MKKNIMVLFAFFLFVLPPVVFSEQEGALNQKKAVPESDQAGSEEAKKQYMELQQKIAEATKEPREKIGKLIKEHDELLLKNAPASEVEAKVAEIKEAQKTVMQIAQKIAPPGMSPFGMPGQNARPLSAKEQEELKSLLDERRQKVVGGAGHQEVADLTEKIRKIYSPEQPPASTPPLTPGTPAGQVRNQEK